MFNCVIDMKDNYFRHGLFILLKEALAEYHAEWGGETQIVLKNDLSARTRLVFIDAANDSFHQALAQTTHLKQHRPPGVFIVLNSKNARQPREVVLSTVTHILYKDDESADIKHKIRKALLSPLSKKNDVHLLTPCASNPENDTPLGGLTKSECAVIDLFKQGFTGKDIAQILHKSEKTISGQKRSAMRKLGVRSNVALFRKIH